MHLPHSAWLGITCSFCSIAYGLTRSERTGYMARRPLILPARRFDGPCALTICVGSASEYGWAAWRSRNTDANGISARRRSRRASRPLMRKPAPGSPLSSRSTRRGGCIMIFAWSSTASSKAGRCRRGRASIPGKSGWPSMSKTIRSITARSKALSRKVNTAAVPCCCGIEAFGSRSTRTRRRRTARDRSNSPSRARNCTAIGPWFEWAARPPTSAMRTGY